jgi:hypothetical protein
VLAAVRDALRAAGPVQEAAGRFETDWREAADAGLVDQGLLLGHVYRVRVRHAVLVEGATVSVSSHVERRAPGGPRSRSWERVDPALCGQALLEDIRRRLEKAP